MLNWGCFIFAFALGFTEILETLLEVCIYSKTQSLVDAQKVCLGIAQRSQSLKLAT